jgi:hypothetical protein
MTEPTTTEAADRRSSPRFGFPRQGFPPLAATVGLGQGMAGLVQDLSRGGISLLVPHALSNGAVVPVWVASLTDSTSRMLLIRIVHIASASNGLFRIGGRFVDSASPDLVEPLLD